MSRLRKYGHALLVFLLSLMVLLSSCDANPGTTTTPEASLKLKVSLSPDGPVQPDEISYFVIDIANSTFNTVKNLTVNGSSVDMMFSVPVGDTYITATVYGKNKKALGTASGSIYVVAGVDNAFSLEIENKVGSGNLGIRILADSSLDVSARIYMADSDTLLQDIVLKRNGEDLSSTVALKCGDYDLVVSDDKSGREFARKRISISAGIDTNFELDIRNYDSITLNISNSISRTPTIALEGPKKYYCGREIKVSASISGFKNPVYRWYLDANLIEGADSSVLKTKLPKEDDVDIAIMHTIKCVVSEGNVVWSAQQDFKYSFVDLEALNGLTLQFWHAQSKERGVALNEVVELFNRTNEYGITVIPTYQGGYTDTYNKTMDALVNGCAPNITNVYNSNAIKLLWNGDLIDINEYLDDGMGITPEEYASVYKSIKDENTCFDEGRQYAVSLGKSTEAFFYNKTFFEEHGLKVPTTLDELTEVAAATSAITGKPSFGLDSTDNWGIYGPMNMGARFMDKDNNILLYDQDNLQKTKAFYSWWENGVDNGWFRTAGEDRYCSGPYSLGTLIMFIGSSSGVEFIQPDGFEFGVARIPVGPTPHVIQQGANFCGFKTGDEAIDLATSIFLEFLYTPEAGALYAASTGFLPANQAGLEEQVFLDCIAKGGVYGETKAVCAVYPDEWRAYDMVYPEALDVRRALATPLKGVEVSDYSIDELIAETKKKLDAILSK